MISNYAEVKLRLSLLKDRFAVCRLEPDDGLPDWAVKGRFFSITRTLDELSIVCPEQNVPKAVRREEGWRALRLEGPLDFSLVGVLASVAAPLAEAEMSIFALSTYDTDYVMVREDVLEVAVAVLRESGHEVLNEQPNVVVRAAKPEDEDFLWKMLYEAVFWGPDEPDDKPPPEELLAEPGLRHYLTDRGREGDLAVVAQEDRDGQKVGAAWCRIFPASDPGYGFVDTVTPDVIIAVSPDWRGKGVGETLLRTLIEAATSEGCEALSLSVQKTNRSAIALYEKNGFHRLKESGDAWIMKADLATNASANDTPRTEKRCL